MEVVENIPTDANLICTKWVFCGKKDNKKKKGKTSGSCLSTNCW